MHDLLNRPLRDLRLSVIEACNFRCPYCMPADLYPDSDEFLEGARMSFDEMETIVRTFVSLGVRKLRLTGGEPLLRKNLHQFIGRISSLEGLDDIALTTNGSLLARNASALKEAGLSRLTVSLDSLDPDQFLAMSGGRGRLSDVLDGLQAASSAGFTNIKINTVVQRGVNESQIVPLAEFAREHGYVIRFIEYMDTGNVNGWTREEVVPSSEVLERLSSIAPLEPVDPNYLGEVASRYRFTDGVGEIGLISSITAPFCGDCHRARISADGQLWTCLFSGKGHALRDVLSSTDALRERIVNMWSRRADRYSEQRAERENRKVEMFLIGG